MRPMTNMLDEYKLRSYLRWTRNRRRDVAIGWGIYIRVYSHRCRLVTVPPLVAFEYLCDDVLNVAVLREA